VLARHAPGQPSLHVTACQIGDDTPSQCRPARVPLPSSPRKAALPAPPVHRVPRGRRSQRCRDRRPFLEPGDHLHIKQMSMPKQVWPNMAIATPRGPPGHRQRRSSTPGCSSWTRSHPPASVFPRAQHRRVSAPTQDAASSYPDTYAATGAEPGTWKDPDPRRRSNRGSGAQNRPACAATAATRRLRPVPSQRFLAPWSQAHTPSCSRQVTSTSVRMVKPGPASALAINVRRSADRPR
jgi:hypothetical protein